ncbi:MAG: hypothetical protein IIT39_13945 [Clostridia bacterium]|nr:hypothetical protein [Clostridia bacterium]
MDCSATGGAGDYTYAVFYKQKAQTKWTTKQDFNENSVVSILIPSSFSIFEQTASRLFFY